MSDETGHDSLRVDNERLRRRFDQFNEIGATEAGGVNRPTLSAENKIARDRLVEWFKAAGLEVTIDEMGNIFGRFNGRNPDRDPVLVGSHVDSQYYGGRFDGVIGVLGGLEIIETLDDVGIKPERPIEVVSWSNEEGVRFQPDMLGSGVFCDVFDLEYAYDRVDEDGKRFGEELERIGYHGDAPCEPRDIHCYLELHVEQGPELDEEGLSVGVVEGVFGFSWLNARFEGQDDHAGPTPMNMRNDTAVATSDIIQAVRRITATTGTDLVGTVGSIDLSPNSINVIPKESKFTIDFRSYDNDIVQTAVDRIEQEMQWAAEREGVEWELEEIMRIDADSFDADCIATVEQAAERVGADYKRMVSGAGHDANYLNTICPAGMIFVPSVDGVSHTEDEYTEWDDVVVGTDVLLQSVLQKTT